MGLVTAKEVAKAINAEKYGVFGTFAAWLLMKALKISTLNKIYARHKEEDGMQFLNSVIGEFQIKFEIPEEDLKRLPKDGPYITISNHPLGGVDGILLLKLMLDREPDFRIIANFLLHRIEPLKPFIMPVNPFENHKGKSSVIGIKETLRHLSDGKPLGMFPAGEVSTYKDGKLMVDKPWEEGAIKVIRKAQVPVVPIYFHAKNSRFFYLLSKISDTLRTAKLPSELLTQKKRVIKVRIGKPIPVSEQNEYESIEDYSTFLRTKTYMLANAFEKEGNFLQNQTMKLQQKSPQEIVRPANQQQLLDEVEMLRNTDSRITHSKNYEIFFTEAEKIPNILHEIGRLREITFREVGEGTNNSIDLDKYDKYYHHMFLWDDDAKLIAGAYRMGMGTEIYPKYGIEGFYLHELFKFEPELFPMMSQSIEMGRAFIIRDYQQKPMPLFLLWKGIVHLTLRYPDHKVLIGGVSISNQFSDFSKSLMIEFMKSHYYDPYVAQYITPKKEFRVKLKDADKDFVFNEAEADLNKFDKIIDEVEPGNLRLPVLIKKYIKQNAKVVAFNVDPLFNNSVDGLMYIRIADLPDSTVKPVIEEFQAELEKKLLKKGQL
ncbi:GNAT family N-acyltransferase [Flavobacterium silvaticum]|uniref:Lysophospholipid acyltransferase family protein n=1 Tax=Flavobacterium silvaticum TaxID=1852020 RepID=A0A972JHT4_9FLAO|nr:lysophospholipid acyltransferase family protein [Flavobacterium silvaticum]NMH28275.1 lysophospholipid acyltransferase family protein [Flavobacterium silvaticum]